MISLKYMINFVYISFIQLRWRRKHQIFKAQYRDCYPTFYDKILFPHYTLQWTTSTGVDYYLYLREVFTEPAAHFQLTNSSLNSLRNHRFLIFWYLRIRLVQLTPRTPTTSLLVQTIPRFFHEIFFHTLRIIIT